MTRPVILQSILAGLPEGRVLEARIGLHWTAVVIDVDGATRCGLGATVSALHDHRAEPQVPQAGRLEGMSGQDLAALALSTQPPLTSLGIAAINALLPPPPTPWDEQNAEAIIAGQGAGKRVALVGHFPFVPRLRPLVGELWVLEQNPGPDDLPAEMAGEIIPQADVLAVTGMTLVNHTLEDLLALARPEAFVIVFGPSTPLSPALFDFGAAAVSGVLVEDIEAVVRAASQGANFRQLHRAGARLITIYRENDVH